MNQFNPDTFSGGMPGFDADEYRAYILREGTNLANIRWQRILTQMQYEIDEIAESGNFEGCREIQPKGEE